MKIKIRIDDPQTRAVWETAQKAKTEVDSWPAWKRGEEPSETTTDSAAIPVREPSSGSEG